MPADIDLRFLTEFLNVEVDRREGSLVKKVLQASVDHGMYGMNLLRTLYKQIPETRCDNCGSCCHSVSIFSLEYHLIMRDLLTRMNPGQIRQTLNGVLHLDQRLVQKQGESRLRCAFRESETRACVVHESRPFCCRLFGQRFENTPPECDHVVPLLPGASLTTSFVEDLQVKVMNNSEAHTPYEDLSPITFFPFEFWVFRYALGPEKALQLYRSVLVPASTALSRFWHEERRRHAEGCHPEEHNSGQDHAGRRPRFSPRLDGSEHIPDARKH